ncbi:MAG: hypothetical protein LUP97_01105 [Methanoregula sp.]|nr:hypothetical protein [Methanoregula sp.]
MKVEWTDPLTELGDRREVRNFSGMDLLPERIHDLHKFTGIPVIFRQVLF